MVMPVTIEGLTPNSDGLYRLSDLDSRMREAMAEYEAIEDAPAAVPAVKTIPLPNTRRYRLGGMPAADGASRDIVVESGHKYIGRR